MSGKSHRAAAVVAGIILSAVLSASAFAETPRERGSYLVNTIAACGNCHTPKTAAGKAIRAKDLAGGLEWDDPDIGHVVVPNITPDLETGIGKWSAADIVAALRNGKRPDGTIIGPPMPIAVYRQLSDQDALAIAEYLRSIRPIRQAVARTQYKIPLPSSYGEPVTHVAEPPRADKAAYGGYLAGPVGHCVLCHTPPGGGKPFDMSRAYGGGRDLPVFERAGASTVSRNITPDPAHGIGQWNDAQIKRAIVAGIRPDGSKLARTMPFDWYTQLKAADLDAIVAYLRTVKPVR